MAPEAERPEKVYLYDWGKLVKDVPEKTIRNHLAIQKDIELNKPRVAADYTEISEQKARQNGWDSLTQKEYFTNIDKYEDLTFTAQNQNPSKRDASKLSKKSRSKKIKKQERSA